MIELKLNKRILLVKIPDGVYDFKISQDEPDEVMYISYLYSDERYGKNNRDGFDLNIISSPKYWSEPIKASEVTEEITDQIMEKVNGVQIWYSGVKKSTAYHTSLQSFQELLTHYSLFPERTILIIEKT